jgi:aspartyl-tRNA(Asn)/glutamyl-tRNA(Gln) amidotransferase subunit A
MPVQSSLCLMAGMVRDRAISPVELVESHLPRSPRRIPASTLSSPCSNEARAAARLAEAAVMHGESLGLLHGVPVTVKDSFDIAGLPTLCGSRFRLGHKAAQDATAVARLRAAGAIVLGKTNTPEFLSNYETDNFITGRTNNPWNLSARPEDPAAARRRPLLRSARREASAAMAAVPSAFRRISAASPD